MPARFGIHEFRHGHAGILGPRHEIPEILLSSAVGLVLPDAGPFHSLRIQFQGSGIHWLFLLTCFGIDCSASAVYSELIGTDIRTYIHEI